jgi:hypothetical protein
MESFTYYNYVTNYLASLNGVKRKYWKRTRVNWDERNVEKIKFSKDSHEGMADEAL